MKTKLLLIALVVGFTFTSCEKCKDCTITYETMNGFDSADIDAGAVLMGYDDFDAYLATLYTAGEFCDDALDAAEDISEEEDLDANGTMDVRVYWDCK